LGEGAKDLSRLTNPIFVALDVNTADEALSLVKETRAFVGGFKVGPRLSLRYGEPLLKEISRHGSMFIDNKYFDIPSTMEAAVRASFEVGAAFCTIHAQSGREAMSRLADVERELNMQRPFKILSVTILTSFKQENLPPVSQSMAIAEQTLALAKLTMDCGLSGLVCSPDEVQSLRSQFPTAFLVTPGVRLAHEEHGDQRRVSDPCTALRRGASALVVGRPIYESLEPAQAAKTYYEEIQKA
jgi:orotidine-5'-phosphate decarboxylase